MQISLRLSGFVMNLLLVAGLTAIWIAFAPAKLGGQVSYVMINGISMEPNYHTGDLALVRRASDYRVGDIVTYHDPQMNVNIIHRIIGVNGDRFVIKGDNNSWVDAYHPNADEIIGKLWIYLPKFGNAILWVKLPANMALAAGLLGGLFTVNLNDQKPGKKGRRKNKGAESPIGKFQIGLYMFGLLGMLFLGLSIFAFTRPMLRPADKIKYQQTGTFFYSASGTPGVYDTGAARSGEPIFTKLTCKLNLGFVYFMASNQPLAISGSQYFDAMVVDTQSGWKRTIPLTADTKFSGSNFTSTTTFNLCQVQALLATVEKTTGFRSSSYTLDITAHISTAGKISGQAFTDTFEPNLTFDFDSLHFYMVKDSSKTDPMKTEKDGTVTSTAMDNNTLSLFGATLPVGKTRTVAAIGLAISLASLGGLGFYFYKASKRNPEAVISMKYGPILMEVHDLRPDTLSPVIDVNSIDDLAKFAERQSAIIMHTACEDMQYYFVQAEGTSYRFKAAKDPAPGPVESQTGIEMAAAEDQSNDIT
jgi:signal peptidase I